MRNNSLMPTYVPMTVTRSGKKIDAKMMFKIREGQSAVILKEEKHKEKKRFYFHLNTFSLKFKPAEQHTRL